MGINERTQEATSQVLEAQMRIDSLIENYGLGFKKLIEEIEGDTEEVTNLYMAGLMGKLIEYCKFISYDANEYVKNLEHVKNTFTTVHQTMLEEMVENGLQGAKNPFVGKTDKEIEEIGGKQ